jgi:hypothetical protein
VEVGNEKEAHENQQVGSIALAKAPRFLQKGREVLQRHTLP